MTSKQPSQTWECIPCEQTYFAGAHAGPGPFACEVCGRELTRRPEGGEPYAGATGAAVGRVDTLPLFSLEAE